MRRVELKKVSNTVLVIDDDIQFQKYLSELLELEGYEVFKAGDGEEGMIAYERHQPKLIITDLVMPLIDGIEVILKVRNHNKEVPIIAISGGNRGFGGDYLNAAKKLGASAVFEKPIDSAQLLGVVSELVSVN